MGEKDDTKKNVENKPVDGGEKAVADGGGITENGPVTVVLKMDLHCEGCAKKVRRCISSFEGVETVKAECDAKKLTVIGNIDPSLIREKIEQKTKKKVELISPQLKKAKDEKSEKVKADDKEADNNNNKKPNERVVSTVTMKVKLHCASCANKIKRNLLKNVDGVISVITNLEKDLITVNGTMDVEKLTLYLKEKLKRSVEINTPPKNVGEEDDGGDHKKEKQGNENNKKEGELKPKAKNDGQEGSKKKKPIEETKVELINNKMEHLSYYNPQTYYYSPPSHYQKYGNQDYVINPVYHHNQVYPNLGRYHVAHVPPTPPPTYLTSANDNVLSDENPNGCVLM